MELGWCCLRNGGKDGIDEGLQMSFRSNKYECAWSEDRHAAINSKKLRWFSVSCLLLTSRRGELNITGLVSQEGVRSSVSVGAGFRSLKLVLW